MATQINTQAREAVLVTDARIRPMMGINVLESLPHPRIPYELVTVLDAQPGTRFMLMAGKPYGEEPIYNGPYVD